jgi:hypothetical protein
MYQTFLQIYIFLLCINGGIFIVENTAPNFPLISPFDNAQHIANVTVGSFGNLYNATNNTGTVSSTIQTPTNGSSPFNWFTDWFNITLAVVQTLFGIMFGGFIGQVMGLFAFPWPFFVVVYALHGFFLIISAIYYLTGKGL